MRRGWTRPWRPSRDSLGGQPHSPWSPLVSSFSPSIPCWRRATAASLAGDDRLGEDDLAACCHRVELANGDDVLHAGDEVAGLVAEEVSRGLAGIEPGAGVGDHLDELGDVRDVELLDLARHHLRDDGRHAWQTTEPGGHVQTGVADSRDLDVRLVF